MPEPDEVQRDLIFDLGMHRAWDTEFYLQKGFRVMALEANPRLAAQARAKHAEAIAAGRLSVVEKALWETAGDRITFYVNPVKDDWSSVKKAWAGKQNHAVEEIEVETTTLGALFDAHGLPYYVKCDIEGADEVFTRQLLEEPRRPAFVSVEAESLDLLAHLRAAGYDRFQIVNQLRHPTVVCPQPPREGDYVEVRFHGHMSGLFGRELPPSRWTDFQGASERYGLFRTLRRLDPDLAPGWLDFHAGRAPDPA